MTDERPNPSAPPKPLRIDWDREWQAINDDGPDPLLAVLAVQG